VNPLSHLPAEKRRLWISGTATLGIALIVGLIYLGVALRKIDDARHQLERRYNGLVCVTRPYIEGSKARAEFTRDHDKSATRRAAARQAVAGANQFLSGLVPIPPSFPCEPFLKRLLQEEHDRGKPNP
jgi:hypothetical protein